MTDDRLLTAAKLYEQVAGRIESHASHPAHTGLPLSPADSSNLTFVDTALRQADRPGLPTSFGETQLGDLLDTHYRTEAARQAIETEHATALSYLVGVTEQDLDASALRLPLQLDEAMTNNDATAFVGGAGNPNTGKTNLIALLAELRSATVDDLLVISNSRSWPRTDIVVTSAHDLALTCIENRERPKFVFVDEGSTHFDARTNRREVAVQFTPLAKRFAKLNVDVFATVGHTGKDLHPELKRLLTLAFFKHSKKEAEFYENWPADSDAPTDRLFGGMVEELEPALEEPNPDDAAPWAWDLEPDLFSRDVDWDELANLLKTTGPTE